MRGYRIICFFEHEGIQGEFHFQGHVILAADILCTGFRSVNRCISLSSDCLVLVNKKEPIIYDDRLAWLLTGNQSVVRLGYMFLWVIGRLSILWLLKIR